MSHFFFHSPLIVEEVILLSPEESHHLSVERIKPGSPIFLSDGKGGLFRGIYEEEKGGRARIRVQEKVGEEKRSFNLTVWQAALKKPSRMDWVIEKLTEIGVSQIGIFSPRRSLTSPISPPRIERWEKIVVSACKQSGRTIFPDLVYLQQWEDFVVHLSSSPGTVILADPQGEETLWSFLQEKKKRNFQIVIGPEGDLTEEEKKEILEKGRGERIKLTEKILRSETASLFAASVVTSFLEKNK